MEGKEKNPQVKDEARYRELRRQGASHEKAARIANEPPAGPGPIDNPQREQKTTRPPRQQDD